MEDNKKHNISDDEFRVIVNNVITEYDSRINERLTNTTKKLNRIYNNVKNTNAKILRICEKK